MINYNFEATPSAVTKSYLFNAVLDDDDIDENVEGFILYYKFTESEFNPDDYGRLSHTSAATLVTIIDNDGCESDLLPPHSYYSWSFWHCSEVGV